ncbi:MAG: S49 family peptidase [Pseudomonadales bacterium]|nr:S49 family peptidase [Pseudomonadales bacterium]
MSDNQSDSNSNRNSNSNSNENYRRNDNRGGRGGNNRRGNNHRRPHTQKEWKLIEKMLMQQFDEQKKSRRWGAFFKIAIVAYMFIALFVFRGGFSSDITTSAKPHTALVDVKGMIAEGYEANADSIVGGLRKAFEAEHSKAIVLRINSPGGSPVQSGMVYREINRLKAIHADKKVYAVITDVGASGAYYIAAAADEIYADQASIVGSIGVISDGFGFVGAMEKLGIERRVYNAGDNKAMLDPFSPQVDSQKEFFQSVLTTVHQQFIDAVKSGRGDRLKESDTVFSGLMWSGEQALPLGLIDGLGSPGYVAREVVGHEEIVDYTPRISPFQSFADRLGVKIGTTVVELMGLGELKLR